MPSVSEMRKLLLWADVAKALSDTGLLLIAIDWYGAAKYGNGPEMRRLKKDAEVAVSEIVRRGISWTSVRSYIKEKADSVVCVIDFGPGSFMHSVEGMFNRKRLRVVK